MTKKDKISKFKKILNSGTLTYSEKDELIELFKDHPFYELKKGCGIKDIFIGNSSYGTKCFFIKRVDDSVVDISYLMCIRGATTKLSDVKAAFRNSIKDEVSKVRNSVNFGVDRCMFTGEVLLNDNTHIDHYDMKFNDLVNEYLKGKDINYLFTQLNDTSVDMVDEIYFKNESIKNDFIRFHNENTHLRAISKTANLRLK